MKTVAFLPVFLFFFCLLKAQKINYGIKTGFMYAKNTNTEKPNQQKDFPLSKGWTLSAFLNLKFRYMILKNDFSYSGFIAENKNSFTTKDGLLDHRLALGCFPGIRIKKFAALYLGPQLCFMIKKEKSTLPDKFNLGINTGINFFIQKLIIDIGIELPKLLIRTPYLLKLCIGYNLKN